MTQRILIISDDGAQGRVRESLAARGFDVATGTEANAGYRQLLETKFDLVIVNLASPVSGVDLIKRIRSNSELNYLKVLTVAEWGTGQATVALAHGADGFEPTPIRDGQLIEAVEKLLKPRLAMIASASPDGETIDND